MTASISQYDEDYFPSFTSADDLLRDVLLEFQNSGVAGEHTGVPNEGGFFGGDSFNGSAYGYTSATVDGYAFLATGDLHYYFPPFNGSVGDGPTSHTLWGTLESITLGAGISNGTVVNPFITFTFDQPLVGDIADGRANVVHDIIWGLMNGSVSGASDSLGTISQGGLIAALEANGLDVDVSVADLVGASTLSDSELLLAA